MLAVLILVLVLRGIVKRDTMRLRLSSPPHTPSQQFEGFLTKVLFLARLKRNNGRAKVRWHVDEVANHLCHGCKV